MSEAISQLNVSQKCLCGRITLGEWWQWYLTSFLSLSAAVLRCHRCHCIQTFILLYSAASTQTSVGVSVSSVFGLSTLEALTRWRATQIIKSRRLCVSNLVFTVIDDGWVCSLYFTITAHATHGRSRRNQLWIGDHIHDDDRQFCYQRQRSHLNCDDEVHQLRRYLPVYVASQALT